MTNIQLYFGVGLPCLTVMTSLIIGLIQISGLREDVREIRSDIKLIAGKLSR